MKYVVGLGNPGSEYKATKHNVGFSVVEMVAKKNGITLTEKRYSSLMGRGVIAGEDVMLVFPQTYMNLSGEAVLDILNREMKAAKELDDLIVICDDINLKLGRIRLRKKGSAGGHKGLESIIKMTGRSDFTRLRVGIATEVHKGDITRYVLAPFKRRDHKHVLHVIALAKDAVEFWVKNGTEKTMARFNTQKVGTS